ncbi:helix-turn-helix domain-containing protein [Streptomyces sp. ISL-10]|uniref:helix-turn-helix domain-containing protein n=1 Tax=Streptomyces sp. ISL-10 TaxID=2819172 RepID=UPI001BE9E3EE|nr:helix-turn-helix transcriptional regulator [Streptomyces sp. ISL-10]MBT2366320.1 helix-turn-helix domain-containing protein [Streptomyces sp. ISL-10]
MPDVRHINALDPSASPLDYYGYELRRYRETAGLTQKQLGGIVNYTGSLVGQVETARKLPTREFTERVDAALGAGGALIRLLPLVLRYQLPVWFQGYAEIEATARQIYAFQPQLVHGLLQTEAYAHAVLGVMTTAGVEEKAAARVARQRILDRDRPPLLWIVMSEAVLYQRLGGTAVMHAQLAHLLTYREGSRANVQILQFDAGAYAGFSGAFTVFRFHRDPDMAYMEDYRSGHSSIDAQQVEELSLRYARLQAAALSVEDSAELIRHVMEERYGKQDAVA